MFMIVSMIAIKQNSIGLKYFLCYYMTIQSHYVRGDK